MKIAFVFLLIITVNGFSQQCDSLLRTEIDKFTGDTSVQTGFMYIDGGYKQKIYLQISKTQNSLPNLYISVETQSVVCFKETAKAIFLFDDGSKDTLISVHKLNCKGSMSFYLDGYLNKFGNLSTKKISDIRFFTTNGYFDFNLNKSEEITRDRSRFPVLLKCIIGSK